MFRGRADREARTAEKAPTSMSKRLTIYEVADAAGVTIASVSRVRNVWWRSWRELPPPAPYADCKSTDPDFSWQGQWPMQGSWQYYTDPQSGQQVPVREGAYVYPGSDLSFIPRSPEACSRR
jgi:hypothetical protein